MAEIEVETTLIQEATIERILGNHSFLLIRGQLLFWHSEMQKFVFTNISNDCTYTEKDYNQLPEGAPFQLINGKLVYMASPTDRHQEISGNIYFEIKQFVNNKKIGKVRYAPLDVRFDEDNVFQPDILFVSISRSGIIQKRIYGAPDFIVEILSESNEDIDKIKKKEIYGKHDVIEYWIVYPTEEQVEVFHNQNNEMILMETVSRNGKIKSKAIEGFELELEKIFG